MQLKHSVLIDLDFQNKANKNLSVRKVVNWWETSSTESDQDCKVGFGVTARGKFGCDLQVEAQFQRASRN